MSDKKFGVISGGGSLISYYEPEILSATDYYPFGMPSRATLTGKGYRFGFNGKENDNDVKGGGISRIMGMVPSLYGGFKAYKGLAGKNAKTATTAESASAET